MMISNRMAQIAQKNFPQGINGRPQQPQAGIGGLIGKMTQAPPGGQATAGSPAPMVGAGAGGLIGKLAGSASGIGAPLSAGQATGGIGKLLGGGGNPQLFDSLMSSLKGGGGSTPTPQPGQAAVGIGKPLSGMGQGPLSKHDLMGMSPEAAFAAQQQNATAPALGGALAGMLGGARPMGSDIGLGGVTGSAGGPFDAILKQINGGGGGAPQPMQSALGGALGRLRGVQPLAQLMGSPQ